MGIETRQGQHFLVNEVRHATPKVTVHLSVIVGPNFRIVEKRLGRVRFVALNHKNARAGVFPGYVKFPFRNKSSGKLNALHGALLALALLVLDRSKKVMPNGCGGVG